MYSASVSFSTTANLLCNHLNLKGSRAFPRLKRKVLKNCETMFTFNSIQAGNLHFDRLIVKRYELSNTFLQFHVVFVMIQLKMLKILR